MPHLDWIWERQNRVAVLLASSVIVLAIAVVDWWTKPYFSLGFLYLFPIMLAAGFLPRWAIILLGLACALLSERFSNLAGCGKTDWQRVFLSMIPCWRC